MVPSWTPSPDCSAKKSRAGRSARPTVPHGLQRFGAACRPAVPAWDFIGEPRAGPPKLSPTQTPILFDVCAYVCIYIYIYIYDNKNIYRHAQRPMTWNIFRGPWSSNLHATSGDIVVTESQRAGRAPPPPPAALRMPFCISSAVSVFCGIVNIVHSKAWGLNAIWLQ